MKRRLQCAVHCAALAVTAGLIVFFPVRHDSTSGREISFASASDSYPNQSVTDWVTYADHVVVVTPTAERDRSISAEDRERGEGVVLRELELRVDATLWSSPKPAQPTPESFDWLAWGWSFKNGDTGRKTKMASHGAPRIEMGHSYVMAIIWEEARCSEGDGVTPAQWGGLGSGAVIPFDSATIGQGEFEGTVLTPAQADDHIFERGVQAKLMGKGASALVAELKSAVPTERKRIAPAAPCK
ncbi:hypothetical protein [Streptomyces sp. NPDC085479]|uniref:hypothetical protein n=1 Tax=Streptomyces sp. NPDC085479 TaxID=3365726 RepID=UPI0037D74A2C